MPLEPLDFFLGLAAVILMTLCIIILCWPHKDFSIEQILGPEGEWK